MTHEATVSLALAIDGDVDGPDHAVDAPSAARRAERRRPSGSAEGGSPLQRAWQVVRFPAVLYASVAAVLFTTVALSIHLLSRHDDYPIKDPLSFRGAWLLEGWVRFDGGWYHSIITNGYYYKPPTDGQSSVAFFPGYPMVVGAVSKITGDVYLAGIVTTFVCGLAAAVVFYRWCSARHSPQIARTALALLLVFPYAWYLYGAMYADALFVLCAIGAFYLVEKDRPVLAGLVAAVATATRPVGVAIVLGLVLVLLERRGVIRIPWFERAQARGWLRSFRAQPGDDELGLRPIGGGRAATVDLTDPAPTSGRSDGPGAAAAELAVDAGATVVATEARPSAHEPRTYRLLGIGFSPRRLRPKDFGVLLSVTGLVGWMTYLWTTFGDPFRFAEVQGAPGWDQGQGPSTWFKDAWIERLSNLEGHIKNGPATWTLMTYTLGVTFQAALVLTFLVSIPAVIKRIGWGYGGYVLTLIAIPVLGSKDWQGTGRYILGAFPVFLALAGFLVDGKHVWIRRAWLAFSAVTLVFLTSAYARGYYLA